MTDTMFNYRGTITVNKDTTDFSELEIFLPIEINDVFIVKCLNDNVNLGKLSFNACDDVISIIPKRTINHKEDLIPENFKKSNYFSKRKFTFAQIIQYCYELSILKIHNSSFKIKQSSEDWEDAIILYPNGKLDLKNSKLNEYTMNADDWECMRFENEE